MQLVTSLFPMTHAEQLQDAIRADPWRVAEYVKRLGGVQADARGDNRFRFPDGSEALVRNLGIHRDTPYVDLTTPEWPPFAGQVLDVLPRLAFVYAKSMPDVPHEYVIRSRAAHDGDYVALYDCIMRDGVIGYWRGRQGKITNCRPARYLCPGDGHWYWSMSPKRTVKPYELGRHPLGISHHINRCTLAAWDVLVAKGWLSTGPA